MDRKLKLPIGIDNFEKIRRSIFEKQYVFQSFDPGRRWY